MPQAWQRLSIPLVGGGEQSAAAPGAFQAREASLLRNAVIRGPGLVSQQEDWLLADTLDDGAAGEEHAAIAVFPFEQQGGASAASQGIAFSIDFTANIVRLHQLLENLSVDRVLTAWATYTQTVRPQITGFEMFGKFYFCEYARQVASQRKGYTNFDPAAAGTVTTPTFDLNAGGAGPSALLFRGIVKHRGATVLGWGYFNEDDIDNPHMIRFCKFGEPDTWAADTSETSAGFFNVGTIDVPVVACAASGQYTIIGKQSEIFSLDGDYSSQFYTRQIGQAHGPVSTVGMASIGEAAVWMSDEGPAISVQGGSVTLLGIDKLTRRFLQYMELLNCQAVHDKRNQRVLFALRRRTDEDGDTVTLSFLSELLVWDYKRNQFYVSSIPAQIWALGTSRGPGIVLAAPTGVVSSITATEVTDNSALIAWTAAETAPDVTFQVQWKPNSETDWRPEPPLATPEATPELRLTGLPSDADGVAIDVRVRQVRNAQVSAYVTASSLFTTDAAGLVATPTNVTAEVTGWSDPPGTARALIKWDPYIASLVVVMNVYRNTVDTFASATRIGRPKSTAVGEFEDPVDHSAGSSFFYWVQMQNTDTDVVSASVQATPAPLSLGELPVA